MTEEQLSRTGGCLCGAVRYEVSGPLRGIVVCHCTMCQKLHGGIGPHTKAAKEYIRITQDEGLGWYQSSEIARRGFCSLCGSSLFWDPFDQEGTGILAGSLDDASDLEIIGHIFVGEKAGFFEICDGRQQFQGSSHGNLDGDFR